MSSETFIGFQEKEKGSLRTQTGGFSAQVALGLKKWEILAGKKKV